MKACKAATTLLQLDIFLNYFDFLNSEVTCCFHQSSIQSIMTTLITSTCEFLKLKLIAQACKRSVRSGLADPATTLLNVHYLYYYILKICLENSYRFNKIKSSFFWISNFQNFQISKLDFFKSMPCIAVLLILLQSQLDSLSGLIKLI